MLRTYRWRFRGVEIYATADRREIPNDAVEFNFYKLGKGGGPGHFSVDVDSLRITTTRMFKSQEEAAGMLATLTNGARQEVT